MRIHSISKALSFPLLAIAFYIFYINYNTPFDDKGYIFIPIVLLVVLYVFHGPLDHWWLIKFPLKFDPDLDKWLVKYFRPYQLFDEETKSKFQYRLTLYMEGRQFQSVGSEIRNVPHDIKCMIAAHGVYMTLNQEDYLIGDIDRVYMYKHPFPSPDYPYFHNVEVNTEDGVIIFSLEQMSKAILSPEAFYNIGYHAYAEAFLFTTKELISVDIQDTWPKLEQISGWTQNEIISQIGIKDPEILPIHITLFFSMPEKYKAILPVQYEQLYNIFHKVKEV